MFGGWKIKLAFFVLGAGVMLGTHASAYRLGVVNERNQIAADLAFADRLAVEKRRKDDAELRKLPDSELIDELSRLLHQ